MRLRTTCLALLAGALMCLGTAAIATAASSPTATATKATAITNSSATLNASINPNGAKTTYYFSYGLTSALGTPGPQKTLAAGSKAKGVTYALSHLLSGTTYYYNLTAVNAAGQSVTTTVSFKTTGHSPAQAQTGGAIVSGTTTASFTGTINTENVNTEYYFVYGTSTSYGSETIPATETASTSPSNVSYTVTGLTPGTIYYYALVAVNGPNDISMGSQQATETWPDPVPTPKLTQYTNPKTALHGPYLFTTAGRVGNTTGTPDYLACTGTALVSFYYEKHLVYRGYTSVSSDCNFGFATEFKTLPVRGHTSEKLLVYVRFDGNHYLKATVLRPETVTLG